MTMGGIKVLVKEPTPEMCEEWKTLWNKYKNRLKPNRKSGKELLDYLSNKYILTEIFEKDAIEAIIFNVTMNEHWKEKLPHDTVPVPRAFFLENKGNGEVFYKLENKDSSEIWGGDITRIFVGLDTSSGFFMVEGSTMLWDELYAFQGIDEIDIENPYRVASYISSLKRFNLFNDIVNE